MGANDFTAERRMIAAKAIAELPPQEFEEVCRKLDYEGVRLVARMVLATSARRMLEEALLNLSHEERLTLLQAWRRSS